MGVRIVLADKEPIAAALRRFKELLERSAGDTKTTAGQYFTPRGLIKAIVDVIQPTVADRVIDPACGTGGFLLAAYTHATRDAAGLTPPEREHLRTGAERCARQNDH